jgi:hypothetical protein
MAQAMRTSLAQSKAVRLMTAAEIGAGLTRMTLPLSTALTEDVARALALRDGVPLLVTGQVSTVGDGFLLTARLVAAADSGGEPLAEFQRAADGPGQLLEAIDQLARELRSRLGESLRAVQRAPALEQATTSSLAALREYTIGVQLGDLQGDFLGGMRHLEAAVRKTRRCDGRASRRLRVQHRPPASVRGSVRRLSFRERLHGRARGGKPTTDQINASSTCISRTPAWPPTT